MLLRSDFIVAGFSSETPELRRGKGSDLGKFLCACSRGFEN